MTSNKISSTLGQDTSYVKKLKGPGRELLTKLGSQLYANRTFVLARIRIEEGLFSGSG